MSIEIIGIDGLEDYSAGLGLVQYTHPLVVGPGDTLALQRSIDAASLSLKNDINRVKSQMTTADEQSFLRAWDNFSSEWAAWLDANSNFVSRSFGSTWDQAVVFADRYNGFETRFTGFGFQASTVDPVSGQQGSSGTEMIYTVAAVATLGLMGWIAFSASKFAPAVTVAAERFSQPSVSGLRRKRARRRR